MILFGDGTVGFSYLLYFPVFLNKQFVFNE